MRIEAIERAREHAVARSEITPDGRDSREQRSSSIVLGSEPEAPSDREADAAPSSRRTAELDQHAFCRTMEMIASIIPLERG